MATAKRTTARKGAPPVKVTATGLVNVNLRLPMDLLETVDARVDQANAAGGWPKMTRTDWLRGVIERAVKELG